MNKNIIFVKNRMDGRRQHLSVRDCYMYSMQLNIIFMKHSVLFVCIVVCLIFAGCNRRQESAKPVVLLSLIHI